MLSIFNRWEETNHNNFEITSELLELPKWKMTNVENSEQLVKAEIQQTLQ